jgi:hypothetical protein
MVFIDAVDAEVQFCLRHQLTLGRIGNRQETSDPGAGHEAEHDARAEGEFGHAWLAYRRPMAERC